MYLSVLAPRPLSPNWCCSPRICVTRAAVSVSLKRYQDLYLLSAFSASRVDKWGLSFSLIRTLNFTSDWFVDCYGQNSWGEGGWSRFMLMQFQIKKTGWLLHRFTRFSFHISFIISYVWLRLIESVTSAIPKTSFFKCYSVTHRSGESMPCNSQITWWTLV